MDLQERLSEIKNLMTEYAIPQNRIAELIGMNESTFKLKFSDNQPKYSFKSSEIIKIMIVLKDIGEKMRDVSNGCEELAVLVS